MIRSPTDSLLFKFYGVLVALIRRTKAHLFTYRRSKLLISRLALVVAAAETPSETCSAIKKYISMNLHSPYFEYALSKLRGMFDDVEVAKALAPAALAKHAATLSVPVEPISVSRTVELTRQLLNGTQFDTYRVPTIATKSCLEGGRSEGGKKKVIAPEASDIYRRVVNSDDSDLGYNPTIIVTSEDGNRSIPYCPYWFEKTIESFAMDWNRNDVEACVVPGPLKARVITKETAGNLFLETIRYGVWNKLRSYPMFVIDRPIGVDDIPEKRPDEYWVSADYDAATDGFHPEVSEAICGVIADLYIEQVSNVLLEDYDFDLNMWFEVIPRYFAYIREVITHSLTGKDIWYPDGSCIKQQRGQLMGGILSFPVLCIYNYCVFHISAERSAKLRGPQRLPLQTHVRINGDDILFPAEWQRYLDWAKDCDELGMVLNRLKTQVHKKRCNLNSQLFALDSSGLIRKVYHHHVYGREVDPKEARRLRGAEMSLCGSDAPGVGLFINEMSPLEEDKATKTLSFPSVKDVMWDWLIETGASNKVAA